MQTKTSTDINKYKFKHRAEECLGLSTVTWTEWRSKCRLFFFKTFCQVISWFESTCFNFTTWCVRRTAHAVRTHCTSGSLFESQISKRDMGFVRRPELEGLGFNALDLFRSKWFLQLETTLYGTCLHQQVNNGRSLFRSASSPSHQTLDELTVGSGGMEWGRGGLEDGNVVVDFGTVPLGDALGDPHDVPALLLLQLDVSVEDAEVELVEEGQFVQLNLQVWRATRGRWVNVKGFLFSSWFNKVSHILQQHGL